MGAANIKIRKSGIVYSFRGVNGSEPFRFYCHIERSRDVLRFLHCGRNDRC